MYFGSEAEKRTETVFRNCKVTLVEKDGYQVEFESPMVRFVAVSTCQNILKWQRRTPVPYAQAYKNPNNGADR